MVRPGRGRLVGRIEVDETYLGGTERGIRGRQIEKKPLIVVAAQEDGKRIGRIRMRAIPDASADSLIPFVEDAVEPGSVIHADAWLGYVPLERKGYIHEFTFLKANKKSPSDLLPRMHHVVSLLKRCLLGTHQGAVRREHLGYYLDESTFRFNRRRSQARGLLFYRLLQQAVEVDPVPYRNLVGGTKGANHNT
jgi:transposase-like protein